MLVLDLDGTVLDKQSRVPPRVIDAIDRAREAGMRVVVCTGRGFPESKSAIDAIGQSDPVIVAGGSMIVDPTTANTISRFPMHPTLSSRVCQTLLQHDHPVLVLKDPSAAGYDYLVISGLRQLHLEPVTQWWFEQMDVSIRLAADITRDPHPEHTVRMGLCAPAEQLEHIEQQLRETFDTTITIHNFPAVAARNTDDHWARGRHAHILEVFDARADKWNAVCELARQWEIDPSRIAAIGDQINDVCMIEHAGLGVAMGNAIDQVRQAADQVTLSNTESGVAVAIDAILKGAW